MIWNVGYEEYVKIRVQSLPGSLCALMKLHQPGYQYMAFSSSFIDGRFKIVLCKLAFKLLSIHLPTSLLSLQLLGLVAWCSLLLMDHHRAGCAQGHGQGPRAGIGPSALLAPLVVGRFHSVGLAGHSLGPFLGV